MTLDMLQGQIKKIDEYEYFSKTIKLIYSSNPEGTKALVALLAQQKQENLKAILQSKRVPIHRKGAQTTVARRILKPKKHTPSNQMH